MRKAKTKAKQYVDNNPIEQLLGLGTGVASGMANLGKDMVNLDNWNEYLGFKEPQGKQKQRSGDLKEGQELVLKELQEKEEAKKNLEPGIDYSREIVQAEEITIKRESRETEVQLREIMIEIKKLADSSKELQMQFKEVAVEQYSTKPGKYHKTFFAWLFSVIRAARMKVEDSNAWLTALHSKKKSREYGAMAKKHGTSFTLNNERTVATQVG